MERIYSRAPHIMKVNIELMFIGNSLSRCMAFIRTRRYSPPPFSKRYCWSRRNDPDCLAPGMDTPHGNTRGRSLQSFVKRPPPIMAVRRGAHWLIVSHFLYKPVALALAGGEAHPPIDCSTRYSIGANQVDMNIWFISTSDSSHSLDM